MKNLIPSPDSAIDLYHNTVSAKDDLALRQRLGQLTSHVSARYRIYQDAYDKSDLESIRTDAIFDQHKVDLGKLYGYNVRPIKSFRKKLEDLQPITIRYTCQYCTLSKHDSIDHYLPQSSFPEFSIYTRNLVLCCTACNRIKSQTWLVNGNRVFLNFYQDRLPDVQYLFADVFLETNGEFNFRYYLSNANGVNANTFDLLENHYTKLRLFEAMRKSSSEHISEFKNQIESYVTLIPQRAAVDTILQSIEKNRLAYGMNHYLEVAKLALIQSPIFMKQFRWRL